MEFLEKIHQALGEEGLKKARWQEKMHAAILLLRLLFLITYVFLWVSTGSGHALARWSHEDPMRFGLVFFAGEALFTFPLSYLVRWIELRLGTNRESFWSWGLHWLKWAFTLAILNTTLFGISFGFFSIAPELSLWVSLFLAFLYELFLYWQQSPGLRKRFKTEPIKDPELQTRIRAVFEKAGMPYRDVYLARAGQKTARGDALVLPKASGSEVVIFDNLLEVLDPDALAYVVAVALGRIKNWDIPLRYIAHSTLLFFALVLGQITVRILAPWFWIDPHSVEALPLYYLGAMLAFTISQTLLAALGRWQVYAADRFALELTNNPSAFERTFIALAKQNLLDPDPPPWIELLFHELPSIKHRWEAAQRYLQK